MGTGTETLSCLPVLPSGGMILCKVTVHFQHRAMTTNPHNLNIQFVQRFVIQ